MMTFQQSTARYEDWLARQLTIVPADLKLKHKLMRGPVFSFLRATFYRWAELWPEVCEECAQAPQVLAVGDLHVENFGTWRDGEGRLVWGINDFDEAARMPYTIDLVRLAASTHLAINGEKLMIDHGDACAAILTGYQEGLEAGGAPWVLGGRHSWLRAMVNPALRDPAAFWDKLTSIPALREKMPGPARKAIRKMLPDEVKEFSIAHRVAGLGSLGRQRLLAIGEYQGALLGREAKALAPSAWGLGAARGESGLKQTGKIRYQKALDTAVRAKDPYVRLEGGWIVRRLAPDCTKVDLAAFPRARDESKLMHAMGWEAANVHLGSGAVREILTDLKSRPASWLHKGAAKMVGATKSDWDEWRTKTGGKVPSAAPPKG